MGNDLDITEGETPFEIALKAVETTEAAQAWLLEQAMLEGRLTIRNLFGRPEKRMMIQ